MSIRSRKIIQLAFRKCQESLVKASPQDVSFRSRHPVFCIPRGVTWRSQIPKLSPSRPDPTFLNCSPRFYSSSHAASPPLPRPPSKSLDGGALFIGALLLVGGGAAGYLYNQKKIQTGKKEEKVEEEHLANWSGTHEVQTTVFHKPESLGELEAIIAAAHTQGKRLRPVGSAISPNGLGLSSEGMITLAQMDKVIHVDPLTQRVRVQAGARVEQVVAALRPHGLTLQNYASVREQQIGGFIQVSAHGTGTRIPPVDEQVVALKLVTPAKGTVDVSADSDPALFYLARCALGTLGVVAEVTLQCVPAHRLLEHTFVTEAREVRKQHRHWLKGYQHIRYMWIPHTDAVVVVRSNPLRANQGLPGGKPKMSERDKMAHVRSQWVRLTEKGEHLPPVTPESPDRPPQPQPEAVDPRLHRLDGMDDLGFSEMRGYLLSLNPLDYHHVACLNKVEEAYWRLSDGYSIGWSDEVLGFDCGGQQWVSEVCFPAEGPWRGWWGRRSRSDLEYMEEVLNLIREEKIAAPAPIEQRWTASSRSPMSPAGSGDGKEVFSWVGIIMYLPTEVAKEREAITKAFFEYRRATARALWDKYGAFEHWAKIEVPENETELEWVRSRLRKRFGVDELNKLRLELDPKNVLGNELVDALLPRIDVNPLANDATEIPA